MAVNSTEQYCQPFEADHIDEKFGATYAKVTKVKYTWTIHNFTGLQKKTGEAFKSPTFTAGANNEYKWVLKAYPNGDNVVSNDCMSLFLCGMANQKPGAEATYVMCFLDDKKKEKYAVQSSTSYKFSVPATNQGWNRFVKKSYLQDPANCLLRNDSLTIVCNISIWEGTLEISDSKQLKAPEYQLLDDLSDLLEKPKFSDVTLITPKREFQAHKSILATRSPVFSAMFQNDMKEQKSNRVDITDVDDAVLKELLRFIYTGKIMNLDNIADGLLMAADKYELKELKEICEKPLFKNVTIQNAASRLIFADLYRLDQLKARALTFICAYITEIFETASYKSMCKTHPYLINEAFQAFAATKVSAGSTSS